MPVKPVSTCAVQIVHLMKTYTSAIWRLPIIFVVVSHFVEIVLVQLSHKTGKVAVLEMLR